ncbi:MAG: CRISPR-associated protein Cas4 [Anaerolineaceae bacterium]
MSQSQIGLLILALALLAFLLSRLLAKQSGLPEGRMVYSDDEAFQKLPKPLYDRELNLVGKPDYVITLKDGSIVPVEYKSQNAPATPYDSHILQLSAYAYLCEKSFRRRPAYGLIRYADKTFQLDYDKRREKELLDLLTEIRRCELEGEAPARSHNQTSRCRGCGYGSICDQRL